MTEMVFLSNSYERNVFKMKQPYEKAIIELIELDGEDVITTSGGNNEESSQSSAPELPLQPI